MPQVDLETLVSVCAGGGDRKIACEPLSDDDEAEQPRNVEEPDLPPDTPPESFWLSKDAEFDWFDRNAFYERKGSGRGSSISTTNLNPGSNSSSQRFSKGNIIGLPKTQMASYVVDTVNRRNHKPPNIRLFPKRSGSGGKTALTEPSSPKVSCMGRVRSRRRRSVKRAPKSSTEKKKKKKQPESEKKPRSAERNRSGFYSRFIAIFRSDRRTEPSVESVAPPDSESPPRRSVTAVKSREFPSSVEPAVAGVPPGLGGMTRFVSGRRSASWASDDVFADGRS